MCDSMKPETIPDVDMDMYMKEWMLAGIPVYMTEKRTAVVFIKTAQERGYGMARCAEGYLRGPGGGDWTYVMDLGREGVANCSNQGSDCVFGLYKQCASHDARRNR